MPSLPASRYANGSASRSTHHPAAGGSSRSSSSMDEASSAGPSLLMNHPNFDVLEWHPAYQSCQRFFLDYAQYEQATQALCALVNIKLPFQWLSNPIISSAVTPGGSTTGTSSVTGGGSSSSPFALNTFTRSSNPKIGSPGNSRGAAGRSSSPNPAATAFVSAIPYIRRLVVTGFDKSAILHGFFGDDWVKGVGPFVECERRNYLFAAKHGGWRSCKKQYDLGSTGGSSDETVPFMKPLDGASAEELLAADRAWSHWLAMEDWMVGPRAPDENRADTAQASVPDGGTRRRNTEMVDGEADGYD